MPRFGHSTYPGCPLSGGRVNCRVLPDAFDVAGRQSVCQTGQRSVLANGQDAPLRGLFRLEWPVSSQRRVDQFFEGWR